MQEMNQGGVGIGGRWSFGGWVLNETPWSGKEKGLIKIQDFGSEGRLNSPGSQR